MTPDAREFLSISGKDQHFKASRERNAGCRDSHAIEVLGCVIFTPRFVEKLSLNFSEVALWDVHPADHESQIVSCIRRPLPDRYPITSVGAFASMRFDFQHQLAIELDNLSALFPERGASFDRCFEIFEEVAGQDCLVQNAACDLLVVGHPEESAFMVRRRLVFLCLL
jgi:hypothetical protein